MQSENKIHPVPREPKQAGVETGETLDPIDIVRETLRIARECSQLLTAGDLPKEQLFVELVASLALARLGRRP